MKKIVSIGLIAVMMFSLSACKDNTPVVSSTDNPVVSTDVVTSSEVVSTETSASVEVTENQRKMLTSEEISFYTGYINKDYNYAFVSCNYSDPRDAELGEIFYNGYLGESDTSSEDIRKRYLELTGEEDIYCSVQEITREQINEVLLESADLTIDEMNTSLFTAGYVYDAENDSYLVARGDTNGMEYEILEGYYPEDNVVVLKVVPTEKFDYLLEGYYHTPKEVALSVSGKGIFFLSSREMIDEGQIIDGCYEITLMRKGDVLLYAYAPTQGNYDITFKLIKDGTVYDVMVGPYAGNQIDMTFTELKGIEFADFNNDGAPDMIARCEYLLENNEYHDEYRVYFSDEYGYFVFEADISDYLTNGMKTENLQDAISQVVAQYGEQDASWKQEYIKNVLEGENTIPDGDGFSFLYVDDDNIPEITCVGSYEAEGSQIFTYGKAGLQMIQTQRLYFTYQNRRGLIDNNDGNMGFYWDTIYELKDGVFENIATGTTEYTYSDDDAETVKYTWNDEVVSETEYFDKLNEVYNRSYVSPGYIWQELLSADEVRRILNLDFKKFAE